MKKLDVNVLMIGNWIKHDPSEWSYRNNDNVDLGNIYFQWEDRDWVALCECTLSIEALSAIPLTEEILLKCGFLKKSIELIVYYEHKETGYILYHIKNKGLKKGHTNIFYNSLHELQNKFYWDTKKYLQIKL